MPAAEITNLAGWLLSATERGPLEGDPDNTVIALYCINYQRGAHTVCRCILFITSNGLGAPGQLGGPSRGIPITLSLHFTALTIKGGAH